MFEKEAEEWWNNEYSPSLYNNVSEVWQKGAEFGYNKGFEFGVKSNEKVNQIVANEWHYVKDGDLPKKTDVYLVYKISGYGSKSIVLIQYNSIRHFWCVDCQNDVIAWKEIVLPELKESE